MAESEVPESIEFGELPWAWSAMENERQRVGFENHVRREMARGHQLEKVELRALARCGGCDDVLYLVDGTRFAVVHLTWSGRRETIPQFPRASEFPSWKEFLASHAGDHYLTAEGT